MKNIIIPVDFSENSNFALKAGAVLAKKYKAVLHVVHVLELSDSIFSNTENKDKMQFMVAFAYKQFEPFLDKEYLKGIKVMPIIKHHKVYQEVAILAKEIAADLIIMGSHGVTARDGIFAGSNTQRMIHNSEVPVLIISKDPKEFHLKKVIIGTDLTPESRSSYLQKTALFSDLGITICPVYVNLPYGSFISSREFHKKVSEFSDVGESENIAFIANHTLEDGLIQYAEDTNADLIAVSASSKKGVSYYFNSSISEDLSIYANLPIMTFNT
ncbi:MAG: nucleotide-binding universal stress UspA family protein [Polaribacter sp.]|jgi:nucleotide-binding universal stress UspA family protein